MQKKLGGNNDYMEKDNKKLTMAGGLMANQPDHTDICLVSSIIKDGVKNYDELIKKFAACRNLSYDQASIRIKQMKKEGKVGYYHSKYSYYYEAFLHYFTQWVPEQGVFPESGLYKENKKKYFQPLFRDM